MRHLPPHISAFVSKNGFSGNEIIILRKLTTQKIIQLNDFASQKRKALTEIELGIKSLLERGYLIAAPEGLGKYIANMSRFEPNSENRFDQLISRRPVLHEITSERNIVSGDILIISGGLIFIRNFPYLPEEIRSHVEIILTEHSIKEKFLEVEATMVLPEFICSSNRLVDLGSEIGKKMKFVNLQTLKWLEKHKLKSPRIYDVEIDFEEINKRSIKFAEYLEKNFSEISEILLRYESFEVAKDEYERTLDLLKNLRENQQYFKRMVGPVTTFLPRNQPLYALSCFAIVPSLMSSEVHVRAPQAMNSFFFELIEKLKINKYFPNLYVSKNSREQFLMERSDVKFNPKTNSEEPVTDVVIFTGTMENADNMRQIFSGKVLFIANGAGHNPIIISKDGDIERAVSSAVKVQLYNQGQDCANPNAILVHQDKYEDFIEKLYDVLKTVKVGPYLDKSNRVGPLSEPRDLKKIQELFVDNIKWISPQTLGVIRTKEAIVEPTVILKPLKEGGNFIEQFAPVFFVQKYEDDQDLSLYFEDPRYAKNAMYITLFGNSDYVENLIDKKLLGGKILHDESTIIRNTDLHAPGIERGVNPYGGYGRGASCISIYGKVTAKPTLPQRDIYEQLVCPYLGDNRHIDQI